MGHRHSSTTDKYTHILFTDTEQEYTCKIATTAKEAIPLIEAGFIQASEFNGAKIFKKRK